MSLRYTHTLIPITKEHIPSPEIIKMFLSAMIERGVIGGEPAIRLIWPSTRTREVRSRFTGKVAHHRLPDSLDLETLDELSPRASSLPDYSVNVSGMGRPRNPPLPFAPGLTNPYHLAVNCIIHPKLRSTSNLHDESNFDTGKELPFYGEPCDDVLLTGYFSNPHTLEVIKVANAGCARFWIEFSLGNSLFPEFVNGDLELLDREVVANAERIFDGRFVQGCYWG
jgi:hypothetical protein